MPDQVAGLGAPGDTGGPPALFSPRGRCCMVQSTHLLIVGSTVLGLQGKWGLRQATRLGLTRSLRRVGEGHHPNLAIGQPPLVGLQDPRLSSVRHC